MFLEKLQNAIILNAAWKNNELAIHFMALVIRKGFLANTNKQDNAVLLI